jgi:hypothetical protein
MDQTLKVLIENMFITIIQFDRCPAGYGKSSMKALLASVKLT